MRYVDNSTNGVVIRGLEGIPIEVNDIIDKSISLAIQDVLRYCYQHLIETDLFDYLLVQSYHRIHTCDSPRTLSKMEAKNMYMRLVIPEHPGLYYDSAIKMIQNKV